MSLTSWFLVSSGGTRHRLPREMIFVGRDDCELMLQSRSVDKQHAVINYDASMDEHLVKDLGSLNGTFVNDVRIPEQTYITLKLEDKLRFGYDTNLFTVVRGEMRVPEEALKHEKFTIQLQLSQKSSESELSKSACAKSIDSKVADTSTEVQHKATEVLKSEEKAMDISAMPRGTPLYGQPSWWGDDEVEDQRAFKSNGKAEEKSHETGTAGCSIDAKQVEEQSAAAANEEVLFPFCREPSYFEIPTKEFQQPSQITESTIHEIPTKDTPSSHTAGAGHASFTIEFDDSTPGKVTIRDHVTKFTSDQRHKSKKSSPGTQDLPGIQTGMMAPENKVADWLAQNNPPQMVWERTEEDSKSIKSDVPVYLKRLKGNKHDDGTQSDSENAGAHRRCSKRAALEEHLRRHHSEQKKLQKAQSAEKHQDQAVTSSTHHRGGHGVPHGKLLKQKSEEPSVSIPFLQTALLRSSGSLGHRPSQEMDKMLKNQPTSATSEKDNDDDQSDKGTYTIELENPNSEEVEARKMIDKVFGVDDNQDYNRPIINEKHKDLIKDWALSSAAIVMEERKPLSTPGFHNSEEGTSSSGNKRWVSQWASLAANHTRHDQEERIMELSVPVPLENDTDISESGISLRSTGSATSLASQGERRRRTLPQLPNEEKSLESSRAKVITQRSEIGEKQDTELQEKEAPTQAYQKDKQDADRPLSKMSRAVNGEAVRPGGDNKTLLHLGSSSGKDKSDTDKEASVVKQTLAKIQQEQKEQAQWTPSKLSASKNVSGQIDRCREESFKQESQPQEKVPGHSTSKGERVTQNESKRRKAEDVLKGQSSKGGDKKESSKSLVRQGSFTIEKPSPNIPIELIPHINKQTSSTPPSLALTAASRIRERSDSMDTDSSMDTTLILKDTEAVMAFLEAKLREDNKTDEGPDTPSYNRDNSISPESDVDTASTISLVTGETERKSTQKRKSFTSLYKDRCSTGSPSKDVTKSSSSGAREKIEKKTKSRSSDVGSRADGRKFVQSSGRMRQPSVDLTDDDQTSSVPHSAISDIMSSDQETYSCKSHARTPLTSTDEHAHSKLEGSKVTKSKTSPVAPGSSSKSTTLPRPRPTRTSLLRRARLGEVSDSELADADKASVASEVSTTSSTSKPPTGRRNISRIDLLAQPRRTRLGSLSARSDSEATISRSSASSRTAEAIIRSGARLVPSDKFSPRIRANSISRLSDSKVKSMTSAHGSPSVNSRWRRFPTDYASTSEDEFGSNRNSPKHTRLRTSPALKTTRLQSSGSAAMPTSSSFKHRIKEQEDYIRDWTAHREEIARISQDLALIAREINDVAGEIDSVTSSGTAPSTTVSTAATTPGSAIDTREEVGDLHGEMHKLVDRVFDESLNFRKIPPLVHSKTPEGNNCRSGDPRPQPTEPPDHLTITRRRTWSRDEVMGDNLLLSSVFQFSRKIRQSIDKTAGKIRILFKDKDRNWDEIESKLRAESEVPIVKTSSMEISSILQELKRVEKQLQAINAMIDPDGTLEALNNMGFPSAILPSPPKQKSPVNNHSSPGQTPTLCPPEARVPHPAAISVSAEFENAESEADFSIHFNRFNPDGEEEDVTVHE
ncbi:centrosomal protein of 170 kDa isoform X1 [Canis lupus baileyi]|uniref:Centrosomal protein of 170 kDa n=1 Tax=Canis lupus familiaris TaxID=9615 RepID=A0A8P0TMG6_CANLF|nr:centrosomal protein of 170 kDa isoform X1 [Canis lupus familiaris]XP_013970715.1 centrosomal protein of 170 kDa isoform X1 [Canis lupus familiaris]XP_022276836.1 centrosomal protein of 170 kDa isoform X1 [Canis lupus familiaris]XP_038398631.1 centrosomal protein of 170 kDa isoform X1 [Canis lupus familiaris]XP_038398632.1 centrosomal protein of 170 kDa isoform X1 [Canis lupus familiaris]XP_038398633.1 centrosomal protein of 170 kDa isoform X1 [Canis lupus familiaris]XP_048968330.1 centroso|eukprot:XP_013970711.1 centrosomal protein of 170 kDa isoform X1 [Canis lupus familiaris]